MSNDEALYITDLDEVSYLFNMRNFTRQPYSAKIQAKAIIMKDKEKRMLKEAKDTDSDQKRTK